MKVPVPLVLAALALPLSAGVPGAHAAPAPQDPTLVVTAVAGPVSMLEGRGGNVGLSIGEDGVLMVDDQFADVAPAIEEEIARRTSRPLRFLLNTHFHGDHTGGNAYFGPSTTIVAHENVRVRLAEGGTTLGNERPPAPEAALPVVTYEDGLSIHFNGERIDVIHRPHAHTDGDSIVWFRGSNVVHLGDLFFVDRFPFVDVVNGGSVRGLADEVGALLEALPADVAVIPGHGPLATRDDLEDYHAMLVDVLARVREALDAGRSLERMQADGLLEDYAEWGTGFIDADTFLRIVVADLSR